MTRATFALGGVLIFMLLMLAVTVGLIVWIAQDAKKHNQSALLWVLICLVATPIFGLILYLILGRKAMVNCQNCNTQMEQGSRFCPACGTPAPEGAPVKQTSSKAVVVVLGTFVALILAGVLIIGFSMAIYIDNAQNGTWYDSAQTTIVGEEVHPELSIKSTFFINSGWQTVGTESHKQGVWNVTFEATSDGYSWGSKCKLDDEARTLYVASDFAGGEVNVDVTQNGRTVGFSLQAGQNSYEIPLEAFSAGNVRITLANHGATDARLRLWVA